jgi:hypothetical protein
MSFFALSPGAHGMPLENTSGYIDRESSQNHPSRA